MVLKDNNTSPPKYLKYQSAWQIKIYTQIGWRLKTYFKNDFDHYWCLLFYIRIVHSSVLKIRHHRPKPQSIPKNEEERKTCCSKPVISWFSYSGKVIFEERNPSTKLFSSPDSHSKSFLSLCVLIDKHFMLL